MNILNRFLGMAFFVCVASMVVGCSSTDGLHSAYSSPRIEGRVVDAETKMPIERVIVLRQQRSLSAGMDEYVSAGEIQQQEHTIYTNGDGDFDVPSKKNLELGSDKSWFSVTLKFMHTGYHMYSTNYLNRSGEVPIGEPVLQVGDVELQLLPVASEGKK